jgi:maltose-binding protein MalE
MTNQRKTITTLIKQNLPTYKSIFLFLCFVSILLYFSFKINSVQDSLIQELKTNSQKKIIVEVDKKNIEESYQKIFQTIEEYKNKIDLNTKIYVKSIKELQEELNKREKEILDKLKTDGGGDVLKNFEKITNIKELK